MSGSRTPALPLVFCHSCENEFYKEGDTLVCPRCRSDFTELVRLNRSHYRRMARQGALVRPLRDLYASTRPRYLGRCTSWVHKHQVRSLGWQSQSSRVRRMRIDDDFDHRAETTSSLSRHDPWAETADDPDEVDIDQFRRDPGSSWRDRSPLHDPWDTRDEPFGGPAPSNDPVFGNFASMLQGITGNQRNPTFFPPPPQPQRRPYGPLSMPGQRLGRAVSESRTGPRSQTYTRTYGGNGNGIHISISSSTNTGGGWQRQQGGTQEFDNFNDLFSSLLGSMGAPPGSRDAQGQPPNPLAAMFSHIMNPANASHGDAVYSQEAFDRVMSQLMEQHTSGGAPGPASEAAISALPKKKVTDDMLDENTKQAECSICMDNVIVDEEVVVLPCSHWFHYDCVEAWLKEHDTCPVCRAGITPKDGPRDTARAPTEAPLHDGDPFLLARRQSGTREHPFVVAESPTSQRRRPDPRRHSSDQASSSRQHGAEGSGLWDRARNLFSPNNGSSGHNNGGSTKR